MRCNRCGKKVKTFDRWITDRESAHDGSGKCDCITDMWLCRDCSISLDKWIEGALDEFADNMEAREREEAE